MTWQVHADRIKGCQFTDPLDKLRPLSEFIYHYDGAHDFSYPFLFDLDRLVSMWMWFEGLSVDDLCLDMTPYTIARVILLLKADTRVSDRFSSVCVFDSLPAVPQYWEEYHDLGVLLLGMTWGDTTILLMPMLTEWIVDNATRFITAAHHHATEQLPLDIMQGLRWVILFYVEHKSRMPEFSLPILRHALSMLSADPRLPPLDLEVSLLSLTL